MNRDYHERRARNRLGDIADDAPHRRYDEHQLGVVTSWRPRKWWRVKLDARWRRRLDKYVGYDEYDAYELDLELRGRLYPRWHFEFDAEWEDRDYPRAFAFNNPSQAARNRHKLEFETKLEYRWSQHVRVAAELSYRDATDNDLRFNYARLIASLGVNLRY